MQEKEGMVDRRRGGKKVLKEWTGMDLASITRADKDRTRWKGIVVKSFVVPQEPHKVRG